QVVGEGAAPPLADGVLRLATVNVAHGRGRSWHQVAVQEERIRANLSTIGSVLAREAVDMVLLQEIDGPSWWSGRIDMAPLVAEKAGMSHVVRGDQVTGLGLRYGTAIASRGRLSRAEAVAWPAGVGAPAKGYTKALWTLPDGRRVTVVSLHLHFLATGRQRQQADALINDLADEPRPLIIGGDFNADWRAGAGLVARIAEALDLRGWQVEEGHPTFGLRRRIDWLLVSEPLRPVAQQTLEDVVSDHRMVVLECRWSAPDG
ncbi:MAG: endonuclease/exonuclease/phosphatase family protein, partial [Planctomycetota bacterium]